MRDARVKASAEFEAGRGSLVRSLDALDRGDHSQAIDLATMAAFNAGAAYAHALDAQEAAFCEDILLLQGDTQRVLDATLNQGKRRANPSTPWESVLCKAFWEGVDSVRSQFVVTSKGMRRSVSTSNPSWGVTLGATALGAGTGYLLGSFSAVPDFDRRLDAVEVAIQSDKMGRASKLLRSAFDDLEKLYQDMGGSALEIRSRMEELNAKLPAKKQVFGLKQEGRRRNPAINIRTLKKRLLK